MSTPSKAKAASSNLSFFVVYNSCNIIVEMIIHIRILPIFLLIAPLVSAEDQMVHIAKLDYSQVEVLLEEVVFSRPENKELGDRHRAKNRKFSDAMEKIQQAIANGEKYNPMDVGFDMMDMGSDDKKRLEILSEKLLLEIIEKSVGEKYQVILKSDFKSSVLYTKIAIDDITAMVRQELLKQVPQKRIGSDETTNNDAPESKAEVIAEPKPEPDETAD